MGGCVHGHFRGPHGTLVLWPPILSFKSLARPPTSLSQCRSSGDPYPRGNHTWGTYQRFRRANASGLRLLSYTPLQVMSGKSGRPQPPASRAERPSPPQLRRSGR